ncbi:portal protein [Rhodanobacter sp. FW102-FHT14D06]|uniref:Portal protein n=2 Tax=unclassified Rhodanobacter TaxID=2621553 RepID=A0AB74URJ8_9GAMM|nr:portal protein [Rhodanobacter sp.]
MAQLQPARAPMETKLQRYKKRAAALKQDRENWEPHWREIQTFISPRSGRFCLAETNRGGKKHQRIINSAPTQASKALAAGLSSGLTNPAKPWFRLLTADPGLMEVAAVKQWLWIVESRMRDTLARSNLYNALPTAYRELGDYGTAPIWCEPDDRDVIRFYPLTVGSYWLATDHRREVDTLYRELQMTVRQVVEKFGPEQCSDRVREAYNMCRYEQTVQVAHMVCPNADREPGKMDGKNKAWSSCYWEIGCNEDKFLRESGFDSKRFMAPRWDVLGEDIYGSSPGMDALGDAKMLQVREKQFALAVDKHIDPPLTAHPSLQNRGVGRLPGQVTFVSADEGRVGAAPIYQVQPDYQGALMDKQDIIQRVRDTYYASLFLLISGQADDPRKTAYEVGKIDQERLLMLGPVLQRLNNELLDPTIEMTFQVMLEAGLIPPPPPELQGQALNIQYISILAQAQKFLMTGSIGQFLQFVGGIAAMDASVVDKVDFDQTVDEFANDIGVPPAIVRSDDQVAQLREAKQQAQQAQQMAAMAPAIAQYAKAAKDAGGAVASPGSLLGAAGAAVNAGAGG